MSYRQGRMGTTPSHWTDFLTPYGEESMAVGADPCNCATSSLSDELYMTRLIREGQSCGRLRSANWLAFAAGPRPLLR